MGEGEPGPLDHHYRSAPETGRLAWACKQYAWRDLLVMQSLMHCWETSVNTLPEIEIESKTLASWHAS